MRLIKFRVARCIISNTKKVQIHKFLLQAAAEMRTQPLPSPPFQNIPLLLLLLESSAQSQGNPRGPASQPESLLLLLIALILLPLPLLLFLLLLLPLHQAPAKSPLLLLLPLLLLASPVLPEPGCPLHSYACSSTSRCILSSQVQDIIITCQYCIKHTFLIFHIIRVISKII